MTAARACCIGAFAGCLLGCAEPSAPPPAWPGYAGWPPPPGAYGPYGGYSPSVAGVGGPGATWSPAGAAQAVAFAQAHIGVPYCWGGNGPRCFDCSGFTRAAWMAGGRMIPRTSEEQLAALTPVSPDSLQPGDILWRPGHVGLYVGGGWALAATHTGDFVRYQRADRFVRAVRP